MKNHTPLKDLTHPDLLAKLPPQALEIESVVLGAALIEKNAALSLVSEIKNPEVFYKDANKYIFSCIQQMVRQGEAVDMLTVAEMLASQGKLEMVGGVGYIASLTQRVNSGEHIKAHAQILIDKSIKRQIIGFTSELNRQAFDDTTDSKEMIASLSEFAYKVVSGSVTSKMKHIRDWLTNTVRMIEERMNNATAIVGVPSGINSLDNATGGFQKGDLVCIAARPSMGKTAMLGSIIYNASIYGQFKGALFSIEMRGEQIVIRLLSMEIQVSNSQITKGAISLEELKRIHQSARVFEVANLYIDDTSNVSDTYMRAKCMELAALHGLDYVMVDYIQIMDNDSEGKQSVRLDVALGRISRNLKRMAKDLDLPVIFLSQLSREVEKRADKRPMLSDLRESGQLEQDCDLVIFLYRPEYYGITQDENGESTEGVCFAIIAKQRNGNVGDVKMRFIGKYTQMTDLETFTAPMVQATHQPIKLQPNENFYDFNRK